MLMIGLLFVLCFIVRCSGMLKLNVVWLIVFMSLCCLNGFV